MPTLPEKICQYPGCPNTSDRHFCKTHRRGNFEKSVMPRHETRENSYRRGYNRRWAAIRRNKLARQPLCQCHDCRTGDPRPATMVHHMDENPRNNHPDNLVSVSHACHNRIHHGGKYAQKS